MNEEDEKQLDQLIYQPNNNILPSYGNIQNLTEKNIGEYLSLADILYYGEVEQVKFNNILYTSNQMIFTDQEYDYYVNKYKQQYITAKQQIQSNMNRFLLQHPLMCGTLKKYYPKTMQQLLNKFAKNSFDLFILTPKFDGVSCRVYINRKVDKYYRDYFITKIMNRSEKNFGKDITKQAIHLIKPYETILHQIMVDKNLSQIVLRGELISKNHQRQEIAGQVSSQQLLHCDFILYEFLMINCYKEMIPLTYYQQLCYLNTFQPIKTPFQIIEYNQLNENTFQQFYNNNKNYYCDGIVIKANSYQEKYNKENPEQQVAFKFQNSCFTVNVTKIDWFPITQIAGKSNNEDDTNNNSALNCPENNLVSPTTDKAKRYDHIRGYNPCWLIMNNIAVGKPLQVEYSGGITLNPMVQYKGIESQKLFFQTNHQIQELNPLCPRQCPGCGGRVIIEQRNGDFICGSGLCNYLYIMTQMKNYYKFKGYGDKSIESDFKKIVRSQNPAYEFYGWFKNCLQKFQIQRITLKEFLILFIPTIGIKQVDKYLIPENISKSITMIVSRFKQLNLDYFIPYTKDYQQGYNIQ